MNRNQRRGRVPRRNEIAGRLNALKGKGSITKVTRDVEEVFIPPRSKRQDKSVANRCCFVSPDQRDFGQSTEVPYGVNQLVITEPTDQYQSLLEEQYGFDPFEPENVAKLKELKKALCGSTARVEHGSQYAQHYIHSVTSPPVYVNTSDGSQWQHVNDIDDIERIIVKDGGVSPIVFEDHLPRNIYISEVPRVKIIAEKFSKYKRHTLELRRLDEKVVCVEYDIFDQASNGNILRPMQSMRAFFSIKPVSDEDGNKKDKEAAPKLPSKIKRKFDILDEELEQLTEKEIEIIDDKIHENKSYLDDFRRILKRKQIIKAKKNKSSLDLQSLYEMAIRDKPPLDCDFSDANLLSKAELQEVKDLILQRCASSVHGIRRRRVKRKEKGAPVGVNVISETIVAELLREDTKFNVFK